MVLKFSFNRFQKSRPQMIGTLSHAYISKEGIFFRARNILHNLLVNV